MTDSNNDHGHDDHGKGHAPFIAHHFDDARQQFDAGKLGIWVFLVTEILFFSGLFCAYVLYRNSNPEIFYEAHFQLDKVLGGANTIVLLFSSLTMALAVRASQLGQKSVVIVNLLITMVCASIFLGVKAVEYSHKWDEGILTRGYFAFSGTPHHAASDNMFGISDYLLILSIVPAILLVVFLAIGIIYKATNVPKKAQFFIYLSIMMAGYFLGALAGKIYMDVKPVSDHGGDSHNKVAHADEHDESHDHEDGEHPDEDHKDANAGETKDGETRGGETKDGETKDGDTDVTEPVALTEKQRRVGIFFSIYYCMTGLHAVHVIGGMIALSWLLWRSINGHWRPDYYGPVDYVGLYWHLVDLIWIYLFPLLYLIK